jgi:SAM-dependent methyltransferase
MRMTNGIVTALPPERVSYYQSFVREYEHIRMAEGRGSEQEEFYLALPYKDTTGNNPQQWRIRSRSFTYLVRHILNQRPGNAHKDILDLGAGNCWMSYRLALTGCRPVSVDLLINDRDGLGAAEHYRKQLPDLFPRFQAEMTRLPFHDQQFDVAIFNASLHYSEDFESTLREALRCVRRDGLVVVCDSPWYTSEDGGHRMLAERRAAFLRRYGTASDSIKSLEYLTDERLKQLEHALSIRWSFHAPYYGLRWAMRPVMAMLRKKREPSQFRIYVTQKPA